ncbi:hypothetical protein K1719_037410 [Acacia pycnantha]|nr:hypothetical protein K1719_037410 [Acacia pycnantha]
MPALDIHCPKKPGMKVRRPTISQLPPTSLTMTMGRDMTQRRKNTELREEVKEPDQDVKEPALELRRSQRVVIPSSVLKSPWIEPKRKSKGKRTYDEKDTLFEMCTKSVPRDEAAEEFVDMHHYFLTREELQCLTPRSWINNKLMTMVAKTLVVTN